MQLILSLAVLACIVRVAAPRDARRASARHGAAERPRAALRLWSLALGLVCLLPRAGRRRWSRFATELITSNETGQTPFSIGIGGIALLGIGGVLALLLFARLNLVLPATSVG